MEALKRMTAYPKGPGKKMMRDDKYCAGRAKTEAVLLSRIRTLAESIILQAIVDLWDAEHNQGSIDFFRGEGFDICACLALIDMGQQRRLISIIDGPVRNRNTTVPRFSH